MELKTNKSIEQGDKGERGRAGSDGSNGEKGDACETFYNVVEGPKVY